MQQRLLGYLAGFSAMYRQGELLCTQGLGHVLGTHDHARDVMKDQIKSRTGQTVPDGLTWRAEAPVGGTRGRVDLEARTPEKVSKIRIEAKLGAPLGVKQLKSYTKGLGTSRDAGVLMVLVPRYREDEAVNFLESAGFVRSDDRRAWRCTEQPQVTGTVWTWEDLLDDTIWSNSSELCREEIQQLYAMYRVLSGADLRLPPRPEDVKDVCKRAPELERLLEQLSNNLLGGRRKGRICGQPLAEKAVDNYRHRWFTVRHDGNGRASNYGLGVRLPFSGHKTNVWIRFDHTTGLFDEIGDRLRNHNAKNPDDVKVEVHKKDLWIPVCGPCEKEGAELVDGFAAEVRRIVRVAYGDATD